MLPVTWAQRAGELFADHWPKELLIWKNLTDSRQGPARRADRYDEAFKAGRDLISRETGIQFLPIQTLYQLFDAVMHRPKLQSVADVFR